MKIITMAAALFICAIPSAAQTNISLLGHLDYQALHNCDLSNLWGYADEEGNEYALVGVNGTSGQPGTGGLSVVDVTDPGNPVEVFFAPSAPSIWREIKVWNDHAYITTEASAGLLIVDLSPLPQSHVLPTTVFIGNGWITSHSLFIDENGRLYLHGSNRGNGGVIMYDLTQDPMAPVEVGSYDQWYCHDSFARGDTLYAAHIYDGFFSIVDVSDPANPVLLGTQQTPNAFTHNCWLDDTGHYLYTTDEKPNAFVGAYDVSDPTDIVEVDRLQSDPGSNTIPHNTYWLNHYLVTSYYTYGVVIYDATYPDNLVEVGHYDTSTPFSGNGFNGDWGVYPFLPSGNLICSDIEGGLYILGPTYVHASWLKGLVTDIGSGSPVNAATVNIVTTQGTDVTGFDGQYATGTVSAGTYAVQVMAPGYVTQLISDVALQSGAVTTLDVQLVPIATFTAAGHVFDAVTSTGISGAVVHLDGTDLDYDAVTDANGEFTVPGMIAGDYAISAGRWGWNTICPASQVIGSGTGTIQLALPQGYYDDFTFNFDWTTQSTATTGDWVRDVPLGIEGTFQHIAPGADAMSDCGTLAFITGNTGTASGEDDVDGGAVLLTSPAFDISGLSDPYITYERWFYNGGGSGTPNDTLVISLSNGLTTVPVETVTTTLAGGGAWLQRVIHVQDFLAPSANMHLVARANDAAPGHVVEAGFDAFRITPSMPTSVRDMDRVLSLRVVPDPSNGRFEVRLSGAGDASVRLLDAQGRSVSPAMRMRDGSCVVDQDLPAGMYVVRVERADGSIITARAVVE